MARVKLEPGRVYGRWTLIEKVPDAKPARWVCLCACGTRRSVLQSAMVSGQSRSCGCATKEAAARISFKRLRK